MKIINPSFEFGDRLWKARKRAGLNRDSLALLIGVHKNTVANWESGLSSPNSRRLIGELADRLAVDVEWLDPDGELRSRCSDETAGAAL